jgi:hypothetical protein
MRNFVAVLLIAAGAIAALTVTGGDDWASAGTAGGASAAMAVLPPRDGAPAARWEYRVLSTRVARPARQADGGADVRLLVLEPSGAASGQQNADPLARLERELNRLGGEGWEMCSAAADGTMVFRRAK